MRERMGKTPIVLIKNIILSFFKNFSTPITFTHISFCVLNVVTKNLTVAPAVVHAAAVGYPELLLLFQMSAVISI